MRREKLLSNLQKLFSKFTYLYLQWDTDTIWNDSFGVFVKGDRNLKRKLAVLLTSQWYYLITLLAAEQYYTTEEPGQELDILYTHSLSSAGECLSAQWNVVYAVEHKLEKIKK